MQLNPLLPFFAHIVKYVDDINGKRVSMDRLVICNPSNRLEVARWQLLTKVRAAIEDM